ncbi:protease, partial [Streptomyces sp. NPDC093586]
MNEGKPTKAKWWSRPRPSGDGSEGDFELARPHGTGAAERDGDDVPPERPGTPRTTGERDHDGDYELAGPAARPAGPPTAADTAPSAPATVPEPRATTDAPAAPHADAAATSTGTACAAAPDALGT